MPDYIYLLESRLSADQQNALRALREAAREAETILFLVGDAVRDLTSGHAVREMEVALHGNALKLKKKLEKLGAKIWGEDETEHSLYLCFPGTVRVDVVSTHRTEFPKSGKAVIHPASIHEDIRRRDFTVNAMAISLNEGSFGLLMDPLNGAADIENRTLRLVSGYGFLEDPSLLIRATRYTTRLGWEMDPRTRSRYEDAKNEGVIQYLPAQSRCQELEQIGHEEEGLKVLRAYEAEGWMKVLFPAWTSASADEEKLKSLHELAIELLMQGIHADMSGAQMRLLTAKLAPKDLNSLKKLMLRPGFVEEWSSLDAQAAAFAKVLLSKPYATPSATFKLFTSYDPEAVLWLGFTSKDKTVQERYHNFLKVWPEARQRIPHALMQELRITPDLPAYAELLQKLFLELIDGRLTTPEEMRAFLEPYSPPAPPPQATIKRPRARRGEARIKEPAFEEEEEGEEGEEEEDLGAGGLGVASGDEDLEMEPVLAKSALEEDLEEESEEGEDEDFDEEEEEGEPSHPLKKGAKKGSAEAKAKEAAPVAQKPAAKVPAPPKPAESHKKPSAPAPRAETEKAKPTPEAKKASPPAVVKPAKHAPAAKVPAKKPAKAPAKPPAKVPHRAAVKPHPAKSVGAKAASAKVKKTAPTAKKATPKPAAKSAKPPSKKSPPKAAKKR
ncbi:MAG TPA: CCA tRNA nucleotidyltransferase [Terracidiphilus sp.]|nr:CCA tRNA nucleotidyltransferase [Terracidiphilus sp.]